MSDKKNSEPQFIPAKDSEEWKQVLHGEIAASADSEAHQEAELVRNYLIKRDEAKAVVNLPDVDVLDTMSPDEARIIYQNASKEIHRRGATWSTRLKSWGVPLAIGGLSVAVMFLLWEKLYGEPDDEPKQSFVMVDDKLHADGYQALGAGAKPEKYPNMLLMSGGTMTMGCTKGWDDVVGGCRNSEFPSHRVSLKPFEFAQHEVTVGQFEAFVNATNYLTDAEVENRGCVYKDTSQPAQPFLMNPEYTWRNPGFEQDESHPVVCVSWHDAQAYIEWLNKETKRQYRLPSEAEWEFAARGGKSTVYFWGAGESLHLWANHGNDKDGWQYTASVGSFPANKYSVQDTAGNVWEWVQDCWHENYLGAPSDGSSWEQKCSGSNVRTRRGGGWDAGGPGIRSAIRSPGPEHDRSNLYGFRIAHDYIKK